MNLPKAALLLLLCLACECVPPSAAQSDLGRELKVGLLVSDNFPFSGPARGPTEPKNAGLEGFEVRGRNSILLKKEEWRARGATLVAVPSWPQACPCKKMLEVW